MPSEKDHKENTGAKPQHEQYGSRQAHAPQTSRAYGRVKNRGENVYVLSVPISALYSSKVS